MPYRSERLARELRTAVPAPPRRERVQPPPPMRDTTIAALLLGIALAGSAALLGIGSRLSSDRAPEPRGVSHVTTPVAPPAPWRAPVLPESAASSRVALGGLGELPRSMASALRGPGLGGFVPFDVPDATVPARVRLSALVGVPPGGTCQVRFASDRDGCSAELTCGVHTLYASGDHGLACVRGMAGETQAWDAHGSFSFAADRVRMFDTSSGRGATLTLELELAPGSASNPTT